jgi:hypothetical protein
MEAVKNLVSALAAGDAAAIETSFNDAMAEKISARLDDMRIDVAKGMFAAQEEAATGEEINQDEQVEQ